jgi:hypothetical protein
MRSDKRALDKIYKRRDRYEIPDWQRQKVWSAAKKQKLIDTILRGWKLPKFYFLKTSENPETYDVVDGQQRLNAIYEFLDNTLTLSDETASEFGGTRHDDLPDTVSDNFDDYEIEFDLIEDASDEDVKAFFQRLQEGLPLTSSEKLNSVESKLRDFIKASTKHKLFERIPASDKRYGHFDIMAKTAALELEGIESGLRFDDLSAVLASHAAFSSKSNVAKRLNAALDFVDAAFTERQVSLLRNRTIVQSLLTFVCRFVQTGAIKGHEQRISEFFEKFLGQLAHQVELGRQANDIDYIAFQRTVNANVKSGPKLRQRILLRKLLSFDPSFIELFDAAAVAESGLVSAIKQDALDIAQRIADLNTAYSAKHGEDLFKATNKTAQAQIGIGVPLKNYEAYKTFIDNLYFLFREGVGSRLDEHTPQSFVDVNTLRTELQHDVDHGAPSKVKAKKKKAGNVFAKFSSVPSPVSLDPERFLVVQSNLAYSSQVRFDGTGRLNEPCLQMLVYG